MAKIDAISLGRYLVQLRVGKNLTQDKLAQKLGIQANQLEAIECGEVEVDLNTAQNIVNAIGYNPCSINVFFEETVTVPEEIKCCFAREQEEIFSRPRQG